MAYAGQIIENPVSGEKITFRRTAADTGGELLEFDIELTPDGHVPGLHVHRRQEERFEVVSGTMEFRMGLKKVVAGPGEVVVVPPGVTHKFRNGGDEEARVRVEVRPALKMEELLETTVALAADGKTNRKGMPNPLRLAVIANAHFDTVRLPFPPAAMQRFALAVAAPVGKAFGYRETVTAPA